MSRLYTYLNESVHKHSVHIEELFLVNGKQGLSDCISGIENIVNSMGATNLPISLKIDGSPAIIAGWLNGQFFVATKSLFNKTPKINFTEVDIDNNHPDNLGSKLKICLRFLKNVIPQGKIYQGDYLFDTSSLKSSGISYTFQPNTIIYSTEKSSEIGQRISKAKMGICFHTEYVAKSINPKDIVIKAFGVNITSLHETSEVFLLDANTINISSELCFNSGEKSTYISLLNKAKRSSVDWSDIKLFSADILKFDNHCVRQGWYGKITDKQMVEKYFEWSEHPDKSTLTYSSLSKIFELLLLLLSLKELIIEKLKNVASLSTFVQKTNGDLIVTSQEGYVVTSGPAQSTKLVSRLEFSRNNFSSDLVRGWSK